MLIFNKLLTIKHTKKLTHFYKGKTTFILILLCSMIKLKTSDNTILIKKANYKDKIQIYKWNNLLNHNFIMKNNTILIFEPHAYHYECSPGYAKYFIDLGFEVDILMHKSGRDSFNLFEKKEKIRLILYRKLTEIRDFAKIFKFYMSFYSFILVQTISKKTFEIISNLGLLKNNRAIYVFHFIKYYEVMNFSKIKNQNRIWTLGHFSVGLQVVPFYFGKNILRDKNKKTRFFTVSTKSRNYNFLISAAEKLREENLDFEVVVVGKVRRFSVNNINEKIKENFIFNYRVHFEKLYKIIESSDYIIITLDPQNRKDNIFKDKKVTGAAQLSYGFGKPALINEYFNDNYNMTKDNSFIYDKTNFYDIMKKAILLNNKNYKIMQKNLIEVANRLYNVSLLNAQKTLNSLYYI